MEKVKDYLIVKIEEEVENLNDLEPGTEEHSRSVDDLCKMIKVFNESDKLENDITDREQRKAIDAEIRNAEVEKARKDRIVDICFRTASIAAPMSLYLVLMVMGFVFEEKGTIRSKFFGNFLNKILPTSFR